MARVWNDASNTKKYVGRTQAPSIVVDIRICFGFQAPECVIRIDRWVGEVYLLAGLFKQIADWSWNVKFWGRCGVSDSAGVMASVRKANLSQEALESMSWSS